MKKLSELLKKGRTGDCEIEGEIGRITVNSGNAIVPEHQPKERIMTKAMRWISLKFCTMLSYRQAVETLNRLLHRKGKDEIKQKTYADFCIRTGTEMEEELNQKAERILEQHGFEAKSGKHIRETTEKIRKDSKKFQKQKEVRKAVWEWNTSHPETGEQLKQQKYLLEIPEKAVYISMDDIGVKHQKEHRTPENEKQGVFCVEYCQHNRNTGIYLYADQYQNAQNMLQYTGLPSETSSAEKETSNIPDRWSKGYP